MILRERSGGGWDGLAVRFAVSEWGISALLVLAVVIVFANSFPGTFILDDLLIVAQNPLVQHPDLALIFRSDYWHGYENSGLFRPLTILSLGLNRLLLGPAPLGFHLVNVLLHAGVTVLLYRVLRIWGVTFLAAGTGAVLFAVHPLHVQVVNEVVGRSELLVALWLLAAFLLAQRRSVGAGLLVCLCYLLALLSKEHAITFVALLPLCDAFAAGSVRVWKVRWPLYAGLVAVCAFWLLWRTFGVINPLPPFQPAEAAAPLAYVAGTTRALTALHHQWLYLGKLVLPLGLQTVYSVADLPAFIRSFTSPAGLLLVSGTLVLLGLLAWGWRCQQPAALFGVLYLVAFLPTSNLLFPIGVTVAERLAYFPSLWFCAGCGVLVAPLLAGKGWQRWCWVVLFCYVLWSGGMTVWRNRHFASAVQLWQAEVANNPNDFLGWESLAQRLYAERRVEEADAAFRRMLEIAPDYPGGLRSRTAFFLAQKAYDQALSSAARVYALSQAKGDPIAMAFDGLDLAEVYLGLDECALALAYLDGPTLPLRNLRAMGIRSSTLSCLGRDSEAVELLAGVDSEQLPSRQRYQYGLSLYRLGRLNEARQQLEAVARGENHDEAWNLLGVVYAQQSDWPAARAAFARAVELQPERADYRVNLLRVGREMAAGR